MPPVAGISHGGLIAFAPVIVTFVILTDINPSQGCCAPAGVEMSAHACKQSNQQAGTRGTSHSRFLLVQFPIPSMILYCMSCPGLYSHLSPNPLQKTFLSGSASESLSVSGIEIGIRLFFPVTTIQKPTPIAIPDTDSDSELSWLRLLYKNISAFLKNIFAQKLEGPLDEVLGPEKATAQRKRCFLVSFILWAN